MDHSKYPRITVQVNDIRRGKTSRLGNPSWILDTNLGTFRTQTDGSVGYEIPNTRADLLRPWNRAILTLTRAGAATFWDAEVIHADQDPDDLTRRT